MKKLGLLFFFFISQGQLLGQNYQPIIEPGKQTLFFYDCHPCPVNTEWYNQLYFDGDTTVNGTVYKKLMAKAYPYSTISFWDTTVYLGALLREDVQNQKVYKFAGLPQDSIYGSEYMTEVLLWDFNLSVGDSAQFIFGWDGWDSWWTIDRIDTITLSDGSKVRQFVNAPGGNFAETILFTEKILWSELLIENKFPDMFPEPRCAWTGYNENLYSDGSGWACNQFNYIGLEEQSLAAVDMYPNPATSIVVINTPASGYLKIHSISGQLVIETRISENQSKSISVAHLLQGIYVWSFTAKSGEQKGKLIIN